MNCQFEGCTNEACIKLELSLPPLYQQHFNWYCEACSEKVHKESSKAKGWSRQVDAVPVVGMGASAGYGSDDYPYTVIAVKGKSVTVQRDNHKPAENFDYFSNQKYVYSPDPDGETKVFTLRDNGRWILKGDNKQGLCLHLGNRRYYQDPHF